MLTLLILAALADPSPADTSTDPVLDFATLTDAEAIRLHGRRVRAWVVLDGPGTETDQHVTYQLQGEGDISRTMLFRGLDPDGKGPYRVEGTLRFIDHPPSVIMGVRFEGFREYRLTDARKR